MPKDVKKNCRWMKCTKDINASGMMMTKKNKGVMPLFFNRHGMPKDVKKMNKIRMPTEKELAELENYLTIDMIDITDAKSIEENIKRAYVGIIDNYVSDCPGYTGKLLFVVWNSPDVHETFGWDDKGIFKVS